MSLSLRDQLLAAGLGSKTQAKQVREDQHRHRHRQQHQQGKAQRPGSGGPGGRPPAPAVDPAKLARDQALEQKKREKAVRKARAAQVRQIVEPLALPRLETDDFYNFVHDGRIARVGVDAARRAALVAGTLVIVRSHGQYLVVPAEVGARAREREPRAVVHDGAAAPGADAPPVADDPYASYKVPDDLIW